MITMIVWTSLFVWVTTFRTLVAYGTLDVKALITPRKDNGNDAILTCAISAESANVTMEWYRVYEKFRRKLETNVIGRQNMSHVIYNVTCLDIGIYECQAYIPGTSAEKAWEQIELSAPCLPILDPHTEYKAIYYTDIGLSATLSITIISNPRATITWKRLVNESIPQSLHGDISTRIDMYRIEPYKMSSVLLIDDVSEDDIGLYMVTVQGYLKNESFPYVFHLRSRGLTDSSPSAIDAQHRCDAVLAIGWALAGLLFLVLLFVGLTSAIFSKKRRGIRSEIFYKG